MSKLKVLVVDDEEEFVNTMAERLELRNIEAVVVTTGKDALEKIRAEDFDVVVLDVVLQQTRGFDVLKEIKSIKPALPVILLSGRGCESDFEMFKKEGAYDYLIKPIQIEHLIERMKQAVG